MVFIFSQRCKIWTFKFTNIDRNWKTKPN